MIILGFFRQIQLNIESLLSIPSIALIVMVSISFLVFLFCIIFTHAQLPIHISAYNTTNNNSCSSLSSSSLHLEIQDVMNSQINPYLTQRYGPVGNCGGPSWTEVVNINMSDGRSSCPAGLALLTHPIRSCKIRSGRRATSTFTVSRNYSKVCGRILGIQRGRPDAFGRGGKQTGEYVDGLTIRHGSRYNEGHIWTFASSTSQLPTANNCPCATNNPKASDKKRQPRSFIGSHYFCDSGNHNNGSISTVYTENPLWDGKGCLAVDKCCHFNNPPWFYRELLESTAESLKLHLQVNNRSTAEDIYLTGIELYISP